jgi:hypothetical protein
MSDEGSNGMRRNLLKASIGVAVGVAAGRAATAHGRSSATFRVAITGDFENLAMKVAPWEALGEDAEVVAFTKPFASARETARALRDFDAIVLMHERIPITSEILEQLPRLKLPPSSRSRC